MHLKVADSFPTLIRTYVYTLMTCTMYQLIIMTHAINDNTHWHKSRSNTSLLPTDYTTRMHTQVRKSPRGERQKGKKIIKKMKNKKIKK